MGSVHKNQQSCTLSGKQASMKKNFGNGLIKVLSLGVGLAIGIILIAKVCFELSYDRFYEDVENIYMIRTSIEQQGKPKDVYNISGGVAPGFQTEVPGVIAATRYTTPFGNSQYIDADKNIIDADAQILAADTNFFRIFKRDFLIGDPDEILSSWNAKVVVSRSFAEKLGGVNECIGKTIANKDLPQLELTVSGVFEDFPENSTIRTDVVIPIHAMGETSINNWWGNDRYHGYLLLAEGVDYKSLAAPIRKMQEAHQPMQELEERGLKHFYYLSPYGNMHIKEPDVRNQVLTLSIIAALLILISVLNYVLVAISDVIRRSRELGVRKCYGAESGSIYVLLIKETLVNMGFTLIVAIAAILAFRGTIETLTDVSVKAMMIPQTFIIIGCIIILIFMASAFIPARMFVKLPISSAFRGYRESKRKWKLSLLTLQFIINAFMLVLLAVAASQYRMITNEDVGYNPENLVCASFRGIPDATQNSVAEKLRTLPFVEGVERAYDLPINSHSGNNVSLPGSDDILFNIADACEVSVGYIDMMGIKMLEGSAPDAPKEVVVSRSFVDRIAQFADWSDGAVGKSFDITGHMEYGDGRFTISGVFADYRVGSALEPDRRPIVMFYGAPDNSYMPFMLIRLNELDSENIKAVKNVVDEFVQDIDIEVFSYEETMLSRYDSTQQMKNTFMIGTVIALLIAIFGLIGFIGDETSRRSSEIAIRKVNGAQTREIVGMFVGNIMKFAAIAIVIGNIAAWFVAQRWLEQFAERVAVGPWYFIIADLVLLAVIVATVVLGSIRVARMNPTISLKKD